MPRSWAIWRVTAEKPLGPTESSRREIYCSTEDAARDAVADYLQLGYTVRTFRLTPRHLPAFVVAAALNEQCLMTLPDDVGQQVRIY